jgi:choline dehydrogenase
MAAQHDFYDFIVVGSGAGGGPLACNLASAPEGYRVALLEAGTDPARLADSKTFYNYSVPGLHTRATEDPTISWEFFVQHYEKKERQSKDFDSKYNKENGGIFYPRAAAVGGCTSHHAMVTLTPHNDDWKRMQEVIDDPESKASWAPEKMRQYFERLEDCQYLPRTGPPTNRDAATRHGFGGWLPLSMPDPTLAVTDPYLLRILLRAFLVAEMDAHPPGKVGADAEDALSEQGRLRGALGRLLRAGQKAAERLPNSARGLFDVLTKEIEKRHNDPERRKEDADALTLLNSYVHEVPELLQLFQLALAWLDPNRWFDSDGERVGAFSTPASVLHGTRTGVRERILAVQALYPDRLHLITGALVTEILFKDGPPLEAVGVKYIPKERLYHATPKKHRLRFLVDPREVRVRPGGEVILAGGTFNTPQLLMLSGLGPKEHLTAKKIKVRCDLPGVGQNLQDRYEVGVVAELSQDLGVLKGAQFHAPGDGPDDKPGAPPGPPDPALQEWMNHRGVYASNGVVLTIIKRSKQVVKSSEVPDLFIFGLPGNFKGYATGYSREIQAEKQDGKWVENHHRFTWAILKGRTQNIGEHAGYVRLRSKNARERPEINFRYFDEGSPDWEQDMKALIEGVRFVRKIMKDPNLKARIVWPKPEDLEDDDKLRAFILRESWGHHACGTCKIGKADDKDAVLDGDFRVRGVKNLRVVDASVFPKIPGFFIIMSIYMISEKASAVILRDHNPPKDYKVKDWPAKPAVP